MAAPVFDVSMFVPGGILPTDYLHCNTNDRTCSRCRKPVPEDEVPLMLWPRPEDLWIYCQTCLDAPAPSTFDQARCRVCGCTNADCSQCIEAQGYACHWVERDLCSRCAGEAGAVVIEMPRRREASDE